MAVTTATIVLWCNGNTADFGSVIRGSSPRGTTNKWARTLRVLAMYHLAYESVIKNTWEVDGEWLTLVLFDSTLAC